MPPSPDRLKSREAFTNIKATGKSGANEVYRMALQVARKAQHPKVSSFLEKKIGSSCRPSSEPSIERVKSVGADGRFPNPGEADGRSGGEMATSHTIHRSHSKG